MGERERTQITISGMRGKSLQILPIFKKREHIMNDFMPINFIA